MSASDNASDASVASLEAGPGPGTLTDGRLDSSRPSRVHTAVAWPQAAAAARVSATSPSPDGTTVILQPALLPCVSRAAAVTAPPSASTTRSRTFT